MKQAKIIAPLLLIFGIATPAMAQTAAPPATPQKVNLVVKIQGIENETGAVLAALCRKDEFLKTKCDITAMVKLSDTPNDQLSFENVNPGVYAVQLFHDLNSDFKLQTNMMGIPTEPFAFSNDAKGNFGPPKFEDAAIDLSQSTEITVHFSE